MNKHSNISLGIFWDIENCMVPKDIDTSDLVRKIRQHVNTIHPECGYTKEFCVACDTRVIECHVTNSLNKSGVDVFHVDSTAKLAVDHKIQDKIDNFVLINGSNSGSVRVIITNDINFMTSIVRARKTGVTVMLIHNVNCSNELKESANESYLYEDIVKDCKIIRKQDKVVNKAFLKITNLPKDGQHVKIYKRLSHLSESCGGKVGEPKSGEVLICFACNEDAERARARLSGQDCCGNKIIVEHSDENIINSGATKTD